MVAEAPCEEANHKQNAVQVSARRRLARVTCACATTRHPCLVAAVGAVLPLSTNEGCGRGRRRLCTAPAPPTSRAVSRPLRRGQGGVREQGGGSSWLCACLGPILGKAH